ncbi:MAG: hypothetical protein HY659_02880 [Rhizobiales bacterium]|nr:hypothetical protein [Hyphomicrobiales bacterium]
MRVLLIALIATFVVAKAAPVLAAMVEPESVQAAHEKCKPDEKMDDKTKKCVKK